VGCRYEVDEMYFREDVGKTDKMYLRWDEVNMDEMLLRWEVNQREG
jgi:hypothetical protein